MPLEPWIIEDDVTFLGSVTFASASGFGDGWITDADIASDAAIQTSKLATDVLLPVEIPARTWFDADSGAALPTAGSGTDLGFVVGTYGTNAPLVRTEDLKALGATSRVMRGVISLPERYVAGGNFRIRLFTGMVTTAADNTCTIDLECREITGAGVGADICQTALQSMNNTTFANKDFVMDAALAVAGKAYDVRVTFACNDAATATAVIAAIAKSQMLLNLRG